MIAVVITRIIGGVRLIGSVRVIAVVITRLTGLTLTRLSGLALTTLTGSAGLTAITRGARLSGLALTALTRLSRLTGLAVTCRRGGNLIRHVSKRSRHCHEGCTQQGCGGAGRNQRLLNSGRFPLMRSHM